MLPKLFLTGASGFLGGNFCEKYKNDFRIFAAYHTTPITIDGVKPVQVDLSLEEDVMKALAKIDPDFIIHLAALSTPDDCERDPDRSYMANVSSACNLAEYCEEHDKVLVIASTDMVFDGLNPFYSEEDLTGPVNRYGKHKLEAEVQAAYTFPDVVICRLPLLYGKSFNTAKSSLQSILDSLEQKKSVTLFTDQYRTPASANEVCEGLKLALNYKNTTIHLGGNDHLSRYEMGEIICEEFGYDKKLLIPALQKDTVMIAQRPLDVSLNNDRAKEFGWKPNSFRGEIKKIAAAMLFILFYFFTAQAQEDFSKMPHTLLWKVEGKEMKKPSYVYGTMHTTNDKAFHLMDSVLIALKSCSTFSLEVNGDSLDPSAFLTEMLLPANQSLKTLYSAKDYDTISKNFKAATGYPMALFDKIRPIYVFVTMSEGSAVKDSGPFLDLFLFKFAKQNKKTAYGLERAEDQFKLLRNIPLDKQLQMLKEGAMEYKKSDADMKENFVSYENADFDSLMKDEESDTTFGKDFTKDFITTRNHNMANAASALMQKQSIFIAIGAAHLPGKEGVLNLLRNKGYRVSPVFSKKRLDPKDVKKLVKETP